MFPIYVDFKVDKHVAFCREILFGKSSKLQNTYFVPILEYFALKKIFCLGKTPPHLQSLCLSEPLLQLPPPLVWQMSSDLQDDLFLARCIGKIMVGFEN